ncbi:hypothetical protein OHO28_09610 [Streptomyces europaeiscabiei]|uniref:hypothetical protein n=1 Tax=Streptomyces europaeiscabiei TaxID=146819 RepID=UPI002E17FAF2
MAPDHHGVVRGIAVTGVVPEVRDCYTTAVPLGRFAESDEVAAAVAQAARAG